MTAFDCWSQAVSDDFYFQMYYDNLPIWGFIGNSPVLITCSKLKYSLCP